MCNNNNHNNIHGSNNIVMIVGSPKTLHTVFPVQCFCHISVNSQEDKRVDFTKDLRTDHRKKEPH